VPDATPEPNQAIPGDSPPQNKTLSLTKDASGLREVPIPDPANIPEPGNPATRGDNDPPQPYPTAASDPGIQAQHQPANPPAPTSSKSDPEPPKKE
jgi:hypothetical protein